MPSSSEDPRAPAPPEALALLEKIEELSALRTLCDGLAAAPDFTTACQYLTELVWRERGAESAAYVAVDGPRGMPHLEAAAPADGSLAALADPAFLRAVLGFVLAGRTPEVVRLGPAASWLRDAPGFLMWAPTMLRGVLTGGLVMHTRADEAQLAADARMLAIVAAAAALGLDAARVQAREEFLATLRHDIKNPLGVALGYLGMVDDRVADGDVTAAAIPEVRAALAAASEALKAVDDLVANYLHVAVIDRGAPVVGAGEVDLGALTVMVVQRFRPAAARKGVVLDFSGGRTIVPGDRHQILRVVSNLVDNAVKYTRGPGRVDVAVRLEEHDGILEVRDDGPGLAPQSLAALFRKHARFHEDARIPGSGLGLYLSKAIVETHGGTIKVVSARGKGSTFTVRLPRQRDGARRLTAAS